MNDAQCPKCGSRESGRFHGLVMFECNTLADPETLEVDSQSPQCFMAQERLMRSKGPLDPYGLTEADQ